MGVSTFKRTSIVLGKDGAGQDFKAFGDIAGTYIRWDHANNQFKFVGTIAGAMDFSGVTLTPDAARTNFVFAAGSRANLLGIAMTNAASRNCNPVQICAEITGVNPSSASSVSLIRTSVTHSATNMSYLRLRHINSYMYVEKHLQDAYIYTGSMDFYTNAITVGGEAAVMNLNMECNSAVTGNVRGLIINVYGNGLPSTSIGAEVRIDGSSAGTLGEGIRIWTVGGNTITTGIKLQGTVPCGINYAGVLTPNSGRTNYAFSIGNRAAELTVNLANAASQNFEPFQMNINLTASAGAPTSTSTARLLRIRSTHDTTDMANLRIMNINTYLDVRKNIEAAYGQMNGVDFQDNVIAITTEAAVGVFNMDCASGATVTGNVRGIIINMHGAALPSSTSIGLEVRSDGGAATLAEGIRIWKVGSCVLTTGIQFNSAMTNLYRIPGAGTAPTISGADASGDVEGSIKILVGSTAKYLHYWPNAAS